MRIPPLELLFPSAFPSVLDELNKQNSDESGEGAKLSEEMRQSAKNTMEELSRNDIFLRNSECLCGFPF